jgi:hypothetical protein
MCGDVTEGGACDQLEECCDELPEEMAEPCRLSAAGARSGGDAICAMAMDSLCL